MKALIAVALMFSTGCATARKQAALCDAPSSDEALFEECMADAETDREIEHCESLLMTVAMSKEAR
jgi:hypothetical protein